MEQAQQDEEAGDLRGRRDVGRHEGGRPFVQIGRPGMEGRDRTARDQADE